MTPLPLIATTCAGAITSLACVATLPLAGYDTTAGLWLMSVGIVAGLTCVVAAVFTMVALMPPVAPTSPQETAQERLRLTVVREQLPTAKRPTMGAIELPAAR